MKRMWSKSFNPDVTGVDFWDINRRNATVHVTAAKVGAFKSLLRRKKIFARKTNIELDKISRIGAATSRRNRASNLNNYLRYDEINRQLNDFKAICGSQCHIETIGTSFEKRDLRIIRIERNLQNPYVWIDCGIHAREWISPATCLFLLDKLIKGYGSDRRVTNLGDRYNFVVLPLHNPDGYEYSHTKNRYWRKNRSRFFPCAGVNLNRNYGYKWGAGSGSSGSSCSNVFRGIKSFSEDESAAVRDFLTPMASKTKVFLTLHSYGQYWLLPFGYRRNTYPDNYKEMLRVVKIAEAAGRKVNGRKYAVGNSARLLYPTDGSSVDWARSIGIPYSFTVELPDKGRYGFVLPPRYITSVGNEIMESVSTLLENV